MSTFFSKLSEINTSSSPTQHHNNPHAQPTPVDVRATYGLLAESYYTIRSDSASPEHAALLDSMIHDLESTIETAQPTAIAGVSQEFLDRLERVDKKSFGKDEVCPICSEKFRDDPHPLVVELPCHPSHRFDLDCIAPWLSLQGTCPLDRKDLNKKKEVVAVADEEEDYDDMIA
jgi:hypothetical protein